MTAQTRTTATINHTSQADEEILGQFYFALGQGAGAMRIQPLRAATQVAGTFWIRW